LKYINPFCAKPKWQTQQIEDSIKILPKTIERFSLIKMNDFQVYVIGGIRITNKREQIESEEIFFKNDNIIRRQGTMRGSQYLSFLIKKNIISKLYKVCRKNPFVYAIDLRNF